MAEWLADHDRSILLASADGESLGLAALWIRSRLGWASPEAWLADLVVRPHARRQGVARRLLAECVERARSRGCRWLRLECGLDRHEAQAFYEALGFVRAGSDYRLEFVEPGREESAGPDSSRWLQYQQFGL